MSIERSTPIVNAKPVAAADKARAKASGVAAGSDQALDAGAQAGFSSIMGALGGDTAVSEEVAPDASQAAAGAPVPPDATPNAVPPAASVASNAAEPVVPHADVALLLAQASEGRTRPVALMADADAAARATSAAAVAAPDPRGTMLAGERDPFARAQATPSGNVVQSEARFADAMKPDGERVAEFSKFLSDASQAASPSLPLAAGAMAKAALSARAAAGPGASDAMAVVVQARETVLATAAGVGFDDPASAQVEAFKMPSGLSALSVLDGALGLQTTPTSARFDTRLDTVSAAQKTPEMQAAETVSFWVTQGVQKAELTLEGIMGARVEVNISMDGAQAQIDFRTDQPQVREVLEGAALHLKDILHAEGLQLSGVSVGASQQDGAGARDQRAPPNAKSIPIVVADAAPVRGAALTRTSTTGRSLDIFV